MYERVEAAKLEQATKMERRHMDLAQELELQRAQFILDFSQLEFNLNPGSVTTATRPAPRLEFYKVQMGMRRLYQTLEASSWWLGVAAAAADACAVLMLAAGVQLACTVVLHGIWTHMLCVVGGEFSEL